MRRFKFAFVLFALCLIHGVSYAEDGTSESQASLPSLEERINRLDDLDLALPEIPDASILDAESRTKYNVALRKYFDYRISGYEHRLKLFEWQYLSSKIIFFSVLFVVLAGIYFAAVQFHIGLKRSREEETGEPDESSEIEFSLKGFKVRSQVLGVLILVISLAFFYLYLIHVYPIKNVF